MGSAGLPRIYFTGYQYWNPNTVNNNDYGATEDFGVNTWDPPRAEFNSTYLEQNNVYSDDEIPPFLRKNIDYNPEPPLPVKQRKMPPAEWGYFGGQQCGFVNEGVPSVKGPFSNPPNNGTLTSGFTDRDGKFGTSDPWVGQPLAFKSAKLVDINPMSFWSSQVFADQFTLGTETGFKAAPVARMHSRFISTAKRNYNSKDDLVIAAGFGAVFQTCFRKAPASGPAADGDIVFEGAGGALQQQIEAAFATGAAGLMLRYSAYSTLYFQGSAFDGLAPGDRYPLLERMGDLYEQYANGTLKDQPISHAYSKVAGWIGLWEPGELVSVPGGRFLIPYSQAGGDPIEVTPSNLMSSQYGTPPQVPPNTDGPTFAPQALGPAHVEVTTDNDGNATRFTLDLGNTFPERDSTGLKADFGTVKFGLASSGSGVKWISEDVPYDQTTYETFGGLVDFPGAGITKAELANGSFLLQVESGRQGAAKTVTALYETLVTAQTDTRGMYAEQPNPLISGGDAPTPGPGMPSPSPTCTVQVRYKGSVPGDVPSENLKMGWSALDYQLNPYPTGKLPIEVKYKNSSNVFVPFASGSVIDVPDSGSVEIQVISKGAAIPNLLFLPYSESQGKYVGAPFLPPQGIGSAFYTVIKCLKHDDALADLFDLWLALNPSVDLVTEIAFDEVFKAYYYGFPVMDFIKPPPATGSDSFKGMAQSIVDITDPSGFDGPGYMPVTRTWSAGQRRIMVSYNNYLKANAGADHAKKPDDPPFERPALEGMVEESSENKTAETLGHG